MEVRELMRQRPITVGMDEPVTAAAQLLRRYNLGALPVCDGAMRLRDMVTDRDIAVRCVALGLDSAHTKVSEIMSRGIVTAEASDPVMSAAATMKREQVRRLPVTEDGRLVGMVTLCDMARRGAQDAEFAELVRAISSNIVRR